MSKIPVIGIGPDGAAGLSARSRTLLAEAEVVFGSEATLRLLPELTGERVAIGSDLPAAVAKLRGHLGSRRIAVVASGDPLFYGTARYLCEKVGPDNFEVVPHVSSMQLAFARIKETWEEAYLTDLAARPLDDVLDKVRTAETVGLFTTEEAHPARIARELLARGIDYFTVWVCENLGGKDERITRGELTDVRDMKFDPLNIMILKRKANRPDRQRVGAKLRRFGNPDDVFAQTRPKTGLITQSEVRAVALAQLDLHTGDVFWDVGAGSGSVAIEAAALVSPGPSYAIEQDSADYHLIVANAALFGVSNVRPVFGTAPDVFASLPHPDAIFVGGNGGEVARLMEASYAALRPGGRLVTNVGTLEMLSSTYAAMKRLGGHVDVLLMNLARGVEQLESLRFEAINPTVLLRVQKGA
ncbi:precorrin-6y -methyltransferase subunit : Precorrin-6Y C5,15-methyltransferase / precorrin-8W decarboxylase OS=uncultured planctomycete GN=HGMM_F33C03C30 PE=4 SV=1: TP_methylase: Methyltransf_18 [Gemmataceae bacterium]|nr:precorrin-6y -methyltransferase subunit : Precorrin-6Y C5,15-methyltransferase / precorrin-8W decarboxylase OS=uncultured planctomycete GN=HGMM_F33C03C30 PE=4 SV=1: TP_methylase: Methyltransf_18 [Gemmataceae bacterium]VTT97159.1 precorrin-6y -methyltransferase subunit : Precorrin-6Y C5,15-methyltransferase / precorrin-8W decarboxylase OS=uncultured planctomycete GN=HGMM_F33C03C30 PE=4 SV=1: TP_methylase: Methyltransf_18 [Gemmataceae bacterium]